MTTALPAKRDDSDIRLQMLDAINRAQSQFISNSDDNAAFDQLLADLLALTDSEYGFIGEVLHTPAGAPYLKTHAITNIAWNEATRKFFAENAPKGMEFHNLKSLFGAVMTSVRPVIANDPAHDPRRCGLPEGHPPLNAFLGIPIMVGSRLVAMAGVSNRPGGYEEGILDFLRPLLGTIGQLVEARSDHFARRASEAALAETSSLLASVLEAASEVSIVATDPEGLITVFNRGAERLLGYRADEMVGKQTPAVFHLPAEMEERAGELSATLGRPVTGFRVFVELPETLGAEQREWTYVRKDGAHVPVSLVVTAMRAAGDPVTGYLGIAQNITERKQVEDQIRNLAYFDALTRLPNRRLLMDRLSQAQIASKRSRQYGALMILDLDNFKVLNDTEGHDAGDRLLIQVAQRLVESVRAEDTVARLGGDEYVLLLEDLGLNETSAANQAELIAEKIRGAVSRPFSVSATGQTHHSTPSIGVTLFRGGEHSIDVLLKQADVALYQAKGAGRNTIRFFNPAMQAAIDSRSAMEAALRKGFQRDELRLFFQSQFDLEGRLTGAEALLRWFPENGAPVGPSQFIPLAEDTGLIIPIGLWVMQMACSQLRSWADDPRTRHLQLAVNVSARQFRQRDFVAQVRDCFERSGADPALLKLELTESMVLENVEEMIDRMQQIKALGVTFSLDDFGTGFSSLSYLKRLPLDQVKIDQSFIRDVTTDQNDAAIVRAIIAMSQSLGMRVIAEGVETEAQLDFLRKHGCVHFQGYLFGKPVPIEEFRLTP